jgi:hypothetical protein
MRRKPGILSKNFGRPVRLKLTWAKPAVREKRNRGNRDRMRSAVRRAS